MSDWRILAAIGCVGFTSYALRVGGFLGARLLPNDGSARRFLRLAPGNLFVAFVAAGCLQGGIANTVGAAVAVLAMMAMRREWAALIAGFVASGLAAAIA